jgi:hypothetical protein
MAKNDTRSSDFARRSLQEAERFAQQFPDVYRKAIVGQAQETVQRAVQSERNAQSAQKGKP